MTLLVSAVVWVLGISAQAELCCNGVPVAGAITIDGNMNDWSSDMKVGTDDYEAFLTYDDSRNLNEFYMVNDSRTLYGRFTVVSAPPLETGTMWNTVIYYLDMDNNPETGGTYGNFYYSQGNISMSGIDAIVMMTMGNHDANWPNNVYKWDSNAGGFVYYGVPNAASDGATGSEWSLGLAAFGNDGQTPIKWIAVQSYHGDAFGGGTWDGSALIQTYNVLSDIAFIPTELQNGDFSQGMKSWYYWCVSITGYAYGEFDSTNNWDSCTYGSVCSVNTT